jgi:16S rRNA (cytosine967-C5)-methyltransferase
VDKYKQKLSFIESGASRLGIKSITTRLDDARKLKLDTDIDLVFVDAPCSGLGTISKKPDIKWKREREDIYKMAEAQKEILDHAAAIVRPGGGVVIYSTCTIEPEENEDVVRWFLETHSDFRLDPAENYIPAEVCQNGFLQTLPHIHSIDGAFAARLVRQ